MPLFFVDDPMPQHDCVTPTVHAYLKRNTPSFSCKPPTFNGRRKTPLSSSQQHTHTWSVSVRDSSLSVATPAHIPWYSFCRRACSASAFFTTVCAASTACSCFAMAVCFSATAAPDSSSFCAREQAKAKGAVNKLINKNENISRKAQRGKALRGGGTRYSESQLHLDLFLKLSPGTGFGSGGGGGGGGDDRLTSPHAVWWIIKTLTNDTKN